MSKNHTVFIVSLLLVVAVFVVFGRTLDYQAVNFDDKQYFSQNRHVQAGLTLQNAKWAFHTTHASNWHPLTWLSLMLDVSVFGKGPFGPHLSNVLLHAANTVLLFLLLRRLTGAFWPGALAAAVFAIHPLHVESVAWISERKDVLSGLFFMLTLLVYVRYVEQSKARSPKSKVFYVLTLLCFGFGLMSKPMLVTLPFVLVLLDYWPLQRSTLPLSQKVVLRLLIEKVPFLLLSTASCVTTVFAQRGAMPPMDLLPLIPRLGNALVAYVTYLVQMIWPAKLAILYPYRTELPAWQVAGAGMLLLAITALALSVRRKHPYLIIGWLWYLGMLVPVIGLVQVGYQSHADRYTYLSQIGLYLVVVWLVRDLSSSWRYRSLLLGGVACIVIMMLMACAWVQTSHWRTSETLWRHALACTRKNPVAYNNLGSAVADLSRYAEAAEYFKKALEFDPRSTDVYNNWGTMLLEQRRFSEAAERFQKAIKYDTRNAQARNGLATALVAQGRPAEAMEHCEKALQSKPEYPEALNNFGNALLAIGRADEAIRHFQKALVMNPDSFEIQYNLGLAFASQGRLFESVQHYRKALEISADNAEIHSSLADALFLQGKFEEAIGHYQKALQTKPDLAEARNNLGNILIGQGRFDEAVGHFEKAIKARPDFPAARNNLGNILAGQGRFIEAMEHLREAVRLKPDYADAHFNLGSVLEAQGRIAEAIEHYEKAVKIKPQAAACYKLGLALQGQRKFDEAITHYEKVLQLDSRHLLAHNNLAWLLATCPEASVRNGSRAVDLARRAEQLAGGNSPGVLDTLAVAYAEAGQFGDAIETAARAIDLANARGNASLAESIRGRLKLYEANLPYREKP